MITIRGDHAMQFIRVLVMTTHPKGNYESSVERGTMVFVSFVRHCLYAVVLTVIIVLSAFAISAQFSPQYRAEATIRIDWPDGSGGDGAYREFLTAQQQLLRSRDLAHRAIQALGLGAGAAKLSALGDNSLISVFLGKLGLARDYAQVPSEERLLDAFSEHLSVSVDDSRPHFSVAFTARDPELAAAVANAIATEYLAGQAALAREQNVQSLGRLATDIDELTGQLAAVEAKVEAYRRGIALLSRTEAAPPRRQRAIAQLSMDLVVLEDDAVGQRALLGSYERQYQDAIARQSGNFPSMTASVVSAATPSVEKFSPRTAPISAVLAALALLITVAFAIARWQARRHQRRSAGATSESEVVASGPGQSGPHRFDERTVRKFAPKVQPLPEFDERKDLCAASESVGQKLIVEGAKRIAVITVREASVHPRPLAAVALVRALARADRRPVLIDLQRDGADSRGMGVIGELPGFSALIAGDASFGQVIFRDRMSRAHIIADGGQQVHQEKRANESIELHVDALAQTYDHVVFDVGDELFEAVVPKCDMIVIATDLGEDDPQLSLAHRRIHTHSTRLPVVMNLGSTSVSGSLPATEIIMKGEAA